MGHLIRIVSGVVVLAVSWTCGVPAPPADVNKGGTKQPIGEQTLPRPQTQPPPQQHSLGQEICGDGLDNNGNGSVEENCSCSPSTQPTQACYTGPLETRHRGQCRDGVQRCEGGAEFGHWGPCYNAIEPAEREDCEDDLDNDCDGLVNEGCAPEGDQEEDEGEDDGEEEVDPNLPLVAIHQPQQCSTAAFTFIRGTGTCGFNEAVYLLDDWDNPGLICCPLPALDILTADPVTQRQNRCDVDAFGNPTNEVMVGVRGAYTFVCAKINTDRYKLGGANAPCYFGDGWSGSDGVSKCGSHPASTAALKRDKLGSDGCSAVTYGGLFVAQNGKKCRHQSTRTLYYTGAIAGDPPDGTPVVMFAP